MLKKDALNLLKGIIISLIFSLFAVCLFALLIKLFSINNGAIKPINYLIKVLAVFLGTYLSVGEEKGILKGLVTGFLIILVLQIIFSLLSKTFLFQLSLLWDLCLGCVESAISGILAVNKK